MSKISEFRVIRRNSKHQVCSWREGVKLYEDSVGTLVRTDKKTKFYTDIVEWRDGKKAVTLTEIMDYVKEMDCSNNSLLKLIDYVYDYKQSEERGTKG